jgi:D-alanyl-D-alanine carboxypeptidase/D-alanyl-D-alanine-endopeptidase (penicillin-binding protein 4)
MVGARVFGGAPTFEKGVQAMVAFLDRAGVRAGSYLLENGSGLSYANHMSAREVVAVLMHGAKERWAKVYLDSLAIAGVDGTLKHRFGGFESAGYVRGKTGTLTGVSALSGFVTIDGQHTLCFAILNNGFNNKLRQSVRAGQARMADALYRHLRRVDKQKVAPVTTPTIQPPPDEPLPPDEPPEASPPADPVEETAAAPGAAEVMVPETVETPAPRTP